MTDETKRKISDSLKGHKISQETREKIRASMQKHVWKLSEIHKGNLNPMKRPEVSNKVRLALKGRTPKSVFKKGDPRITGDKNANWKGGITPINEKTRRSPEYKRWRIAVFVRDNYTCQFCGESAGRLDADHIKPFSLFPSLRLELDNGRTLCKKCHENTETYAGGVRNYAIS